VYVLDISNVHVKEHCGLVSNDTGTVYFTFLISPLKNRAPIEKETYVTVNHPVLGEAYPVLAIVSEIKSYQEVAGSSLVERVGKMLATAQIVGYVSAKDENRVLHKLRVPPNPGAQVYMPYADFLQDIFTRNSQGKPYTQPLWLGEIHAYATTAQDKLARINFYLDANEVLGKHMLIAAIDGAGKTHTGSVLVEEVAAKTASPIVILDPYSEYNRSGKGAKLAVPERWKTSPDSAKPEVKEVLEKSIKANKVTIVNPTDLTPQEKQALFEHCLASLVKSRQEGKIGPVFVVVEDAENFKRGLLEEVTHEGRKAGVSLCLLATNPSELGGRILAHMGTVFIGKTVEKSDVDCMRNAAGENAAYLPQLTIGEWVVNTLTSALPIQVTVRNHSSVLQ
jgi:DNA helicase HerA-like ATPase